MSAHQDRVLDFIEYIKSSDRDIFLLVTSYAYRFKENEFKRSESQKGVAHDVTAKYKLSTDSMFLWKLQGMTALLDMLMLNGLDPALLYQCILECQRIKNPCFIPSMQWRGNKLEKIMRYIEITQHHSTALHINESIT